MRSPPVDPEVAWERIRASYRRQLLTPSLLAMTFSTGLVDAISYLALGSVFTANMTGNVVLLGFALAGVQDFEVLRALLALVAFATGAALAGRFARRWHHTPFHWFRVMTGVEIVLIAVVGVLMIDLVAGIETPNEWRRYAAISILAFAMGLQNATVRRLGFTDIPTTVATSTLSDLGSDTGLDGVLRRRQGLRFTAIVLMIAGAALGALLIKTSPLLAIGMIELVLVAVAGQQLHIVLTVPRQVAEAPESGTAHVAPKGQPDEIESELGPDASGA